MDVLLTLSQAADEFGVNRGTLAYYCAQGSLKCVYERIPDRQGNAQRTRLVKRQDVRRVVAKIQPARIEWSADEDAALIELCRVASSAQIAAYLGRTKHGVNHRVKELKKYGLIGKRIYNRSPSSMPYGGILIAKTCVTCGKLRSEEYYTRTNKNRQYDARCNVCNAVRHKRRRRENDPDQPTNEQLLQEITEPHAVNRGQEYTSNEIELICDKSKSELEVALTIGRTYFGVMWKRSALGLLEPRAPKWKFRRQPDTYWVINFPNKIIEIQEHFKSIGPVPDGLWEFSDDEIASQDHRPRGERVA